MRGKAINIYSLTDKRLKRNWDICKSSPEWNENVNNSDFRFNKCEFEFLEGMFQISDLVLISTWFDNTPTQSE